MSYWAFPTRVAAQSALPTLVGPFGPEKWDTPVPLDDGRWVIAAFPGAGTPIGAEEVPIPALLANGISVKRPLRPLPSQ
jgi:hypothetical protein